MRAWIVAGIVVTVVAGCGSSGTKTLTTGRISWASIGESRPAGDATAARATTIAQHSRLVQRLVGPRAEPLESFVWLGTVRRPRVVVLSYHLARQRTIDAVVPFALNPPDAPAKGDCVSPYAPGWKRLRAARATVVFVGVDVVTQRVADVETNADRQVESSVPGRPFPECREIPSG